jgi:hypothetical protein
MFSVALRAATSRRAPRFDPGGPGSEIRNNGTLIPERAKASLAKGAVYCELVYRPSGKGSPLPLKFAVFQLLSPHDFCPPQVLPRVNLN